MAELHIQPKKSAPSPWLLVLLVLLALGLAAYFYLRPDPADEPAAPVPAAAQAPAGAPAPDTAATEARAAVPADNDSVTAAAAAQPAATSPTRAALLELIPTLVELTDRPELRDDAAIREQRDNFTSATARLADGDPHASLRPGLVAAANLLRAIQQKNYPNLEAETNRLVAHASQLSGRDATPAEQAANKAYLANLAELLNMLSYPPKDIL